MDTTLLTSNPLKTLFGRGCVECDTTPLICPSCASGTVCIQTSLTCTQCPYRQCVPEGQSGTTDSAGNVNNGTSRGPNIGAIVGGIIGGLVVVGLATWLVWRFVIKKRRQQWEAEYEAYSSEKSGSEYARSFSARSRASMASTTYTRASNVIQIAFIPGVTGRADDAGHTPPVPPIPSSQSNSPYSDTSGDHYFMPGDLRDSTYSGFTDDGASISDRRSMARSIAPSIAPSLLRQSVASALFTNDAVQNPMPAQTGQRGRANMVSVSRSAGPIRTPIAPPVTNPDKTILSVGPTRTSPGTSNLRNETHNSVVPAIQVTPDNASDMTASTVPAEVKGAIEQATRRASQQPVHGGLGSTKSRDPSPFSDANRIIDGSEGEASP